MGGYHEDALPHDAEQPQRLREDTLLRFLSEAIVRHREQSARTTSPRTDTKEEERTPTNVPAGS